MIYNVLKKERGFDIIETTTQTILELNYENNKAEATCRNLNSGSGFDGWTPSFFSVKFKNK